MVGGTIIEVHKEPGRYRLWCMDRRGDEAAVYISPCPLVHVGDSVWWQEDMVYWTPKLSNIRDVIAFKKLGNSFDPRRKPATTQEGDDG